MGNNNSKGGKGGNGDSDSRPVDQVEGGPERRPDGQSTGGDQRRQGSAREFGKDAQQPGGGRPSESEKPDSPDSRWGSGNDRK